MNILPGTSHLWLALCVTTLCATVVAEYRGSWVYNGTAAAVRNPERGFRTDIDDIRHPDDRSLEALSVSLAYCYLAAFIGKDLPQSELDAIESGLSELRSQNVTVILRFAYSKSLNPTTGPTFDDILRHAHSLQPVIKRSADSIMAVQAGFIGYHGEWRNSFNHLEANHSQLASLVSMELYDWTGGDTARQVQVASPLYKENWLLQQSVPNQKQWKRDIVTNTSQRSPAAFARIGYHDDKFMSPSNEVNAMPWMTGQDTDTPGNPLFDYKTAESPFVSVDGSLDAANPNTVDGFQAALRMRLQHYDTFSVTHGYDPSGKQPGSINSWMKEKLNTSLLQQYYMPAQTEYLQVAHSMFDYISDHLGYRLQVVSASYSVTPFIEHNITLDVSVSNFGFSAPVNIRNAYLVFIDEQGTGAMSDVVFTSRIKTCDPRVWHPYIANDPEFLISTHSIHHYAALPGNVFGKSWRMGVHLTSYSGAPLQGSSSVAVRFANADVPWWTTADGLGGVNILGTVQVPN